MALSCSLIGSGVIGTISTGILVKTVVGEDHGAGQPQRPSDKQFRKWSVAFVLWIGVLVVSWYLGKLGGPVACARMPAVLQGVPPFWIGVGISVVIYLTFLFFKEVVA